MHPFSVQGDVHPLAGKRTREGKGRLGTDEGSGGDDASAVQQEGGEADGRAPISMGQ